jgi:hypothetical protein
MTLLKRLAVSLLLVAGILMVPATAQAAVAPAAIPSSCGPELICGYVNTQYDTDQGYELDPVRPSGTCVVLFYRNALSSLWNASGHTIRLFKNTGCTGTDYKTINNGDGKHQFSIQLGITWDNSVDAYKIL